MTETPVGPGAPSPESRETLALFALVETVVSSLTLDEVLDRILDQVERVFGARAVWIRLFDEATGRLEVKAARGAGTASILRADLRPTQGVTAIALSSRSIVTVPDIQADPRVHNRAAFAAAGINEVIIAPLIAGGRTIGTLAYCPSDPDQAGQPEQRLLALLTFFAAHAAVAIQHAATYAEAVAARDRAERLTRRLAALHRLEEAAGEAADLPSLLGRAAALAGEALGGGRGAVGLLKSVEGCRPGPRSALLLRMADRCDGRLIIGTAGTATEAGADVRWRTLPLGRLAALRSLLEAGRRAVVLKEPGADPRLGRLGRLLAASGTRQILLAPVVSGGRLLGGLAVDDAAGSRPPFDAEDLALAEALGARLGAAIDRMELVESERRRSSELLALQRTTQQLAANLSLSGLLPVVVEEAARLLEADAVSLRLREGDDLVLAAHTPTLTEEALHRRTPIGQRVAGLVAARNAPVIIEDLARDPRTRHTAVLQQLGVRSYLGVPIRTRGTVAGVLGLYSRRCRSVGPREVELAATLADVVAIALGNARLFEQVSDAMREWEALFDAMQEGIALIDADGRIVRANRSLAQFVGIPAHELIGCPFAEVAPGLEPGGEGPQGGRTLALSVSPLADRDGRGVGAVYAVRDVTREKRLREQLLQSEKLASIGQLVSGVAHELNNPLAAIMGYAQLLLRQVDDLKLARDLTQVQAQAERAARIVQNLLAFARKHRPEKRALSLNDVAGSVLELQGYDLRVSNIEVETVLDPDLPSVMADFHQLEEVVLNVLVNAKQAILGAKRGGHIRVETRAVQLNGRLAVRLVVRDDGPGIPAEQLHRIFDPFFTTKPVGVGTGLGLSICFGIVREHGGQIWLESEPGVGTTVVIELPAAGQLPLAASRPALRPDAHPMPAATAEPSSPAPDPGPTPATPDSRASSAAGEAGAGAQGRGPGCPPSPGVSSRQDGTERGPHGAQHRGAVFRGVSPAGCSGSRGRDAVWILVVDDEPPIREVLAEMLRLDGYEVEAAEDGRAAMARLSARAFDLVITDVKMPGMSGLELADWIAAHQPALASRIVYITGDTVGVPTQGLLEASGRPFLTKPFTHTELLALVRSAIGTDAPVSS